jgi:SAM-dependent methyltransferase
LAPIETTTEVPVNLIDIVNHTPTTADCWDGQYKIPWDEPAFSQRMLAEHLSQDHDMASRTADKIDAQVRWLHEVILGGHSARILDLACGPGLYTERLTALGHTCRAIDFSPASIEYARSHAARPDQCEFVLGDLRFADLGGDYDLAIMIYGEFNAFAPSEAETLLARTHRALRPGATIVIEAHTPEQIERTGTAQGSWYGEPSGLFSDRPHLCLMTNQWHSEQSVAETTFFIIDAATAEMTVHRNTLQGYSLDAYRSMLTAAGFSSVEILPAWGKSELSPRDELLLLRARA